MALGGEELSEKQRWGGRGGERKEGEQMDLLKYPLGHGRWYFPVVPEDNSITAAGPEVSLVVG